MRRVEIHCLQGRQFEIFRAGSPFNVTPQTSPTPEYASHRILTLILDIRVDIANTKRFKLPKRKVVSRLSALPLLNDLSPICAGWKVCDPPPPSLPPSPCSWLFWISK